jgi:hypothetical protein
MPDIPETRHVGGKIGSKQGFRHLLQAEYLGVKSFPLGDLQLHAMVHMCHELYKKKCCE